MKNKLIDGSSNTHIQFSRSKDENDNYVNYKLQKESNPNLGYIGGCLIIFESDI
ncbi:15883_t:CDS:2, partial [Gigaspora rosea]